MFVNNELLPLSTILKFLVFILKTAQKFADEARHVIRRTPFNPKIHFFIPIKALIRLILEYAYPTILS